jgi:hypothetical protein
MLCDAVFSRQPPRRLMAPIRFRLVVAPTPRITGGSGKANVNDSFKILNKDNSISPETVVEFPQRRQLKLPQNAC